MDPDVVGCTGRVAIRVRGPQRPGEVLVRVRGGLEAFIGYADEELERDAAVLVIASRGHRAVDVVRWVPGPSEMSLDQPGPPGSQER